MEYSTSTKKIFDFVTKSCKRKKTRKSATPTQIIPLDEQTKNDFELRHDTKLKDTMIYLDPDYNFRLSPALLAFAVENRIHIRKSKYNPGSTETDQIIEHELTHVLKDAQMNPLMSLKWGQISMKRFAFTTAKKSDMSSTLLENTGQPQKKSTKDF